MFRTNLLFCLPLVLFVSAASLSCEGPDDGDDAGGDVADDDVGEDDDSAVDDDAHDDDFDDDGFDDDGFDDDGADDDTLDDDTEDDDSFDPLSLDGVDPSEGGASVPTVVTLSGAGFAEGLRVFVGDVEATNISVISDSEAEAEFGSVELTERGPKDVRVERGADSDVLPGAFTYVFDEDPIVFVHGYIVNASEWDVMKDRFRELGYPDDRLWAVNFSSSIQSSRINAEDELPPYVDSVLAATGASKVDIIAHSMGGLSTRLWIKSYGGADKVRDYISLSGTHHGTEWSCLIPWLGEGSAETCPAYASEDDSVNAVQWDLNGDPDTADVDETPFGVEDGGGIYWNALRTTADIIDVPSHTCCLNQSSRGDCSDPVNVTVHGVGHIEMAFDPDVFAIARDMAREHNVSKP